MPISSLRVFDKVALCQLGPWLERAEYLPTTTVTSSILQLCSHGALKFVRDEFFQHEMNLI